MHKKWVLNEQKRRYYPYYYFAHSKDGEIDWCYIRKAFALEILSSEKLQRKYRLLKPIKTEFGKPIGKVRRKNVRKRKERKR